MEAPQTGESSENVAAVQMDLAVWKTLLEIKSPECSIVCRKITDNLSGLTVHGKNVFFIFPGRI